MSVSWQALGSLSALSLAAPPSSIRTRCSSLPGFQEMSPGPLRLESRSDFINLAQSEKVIEKNRDFVPGKDGQEQNEEDEGISMSTIQVPRQKYIPVSKAELLDAIVLMMFESQQDDGDDAHHFLLLSSCLDSILHAEHKGILEEMRTDYSFSHSMGKRKTINDGSASSDSASSDGKFVTNGKESEYAGDDINGVGSVERYEEEDNELDKPISFIHGLDLRNLLGSSDKNVKKYSDGGSRVAVATRFQRTFMQLLYDAQFEELSARDLMLTSAMNTDYLLTLPVYVDWKRASESNAIIFRRGYATERQKGLLIVEKLDYIQSKLLRGIFFIISKPLGKLVTWINEALKTAIQTKEVQEWSERMKLWLKDLSVFQQSSLYNQRVSDDLLGVQQLSDRDLPIWLAAQRAVTRYEGILSPVGPRRRLLRKLLSWIGLIPPTPETPYELDKDSNSSESYKRPIFLSRISLSDIWRPASRKYCGNNLWKIFKTSISILLSQSILQEAAFQELILLYTKEDSKSDAESKADVQSLQLKIYERIPIPDLPVIFPHKKLSFRIIDTVRLDASTIVGLLAFFINYKFEDVLSSPSAVVLDAVAISALIIYVSRVVLGYKQTWDRYQLLVNKTLYEKTLASGFGSVHFLLDASEQQQYKEAILAYAILLKAEKGQVEMPIDKAINTLVRLGLVVTETDAIDASDGVQAVPCPKAYEGLKERWNCLLR
ncbi:uncharacterized protein LOC133862961 isoform X2 [Alnus glutinosa]|uniref:uncharacterized protein LOC133862961 isoform X2 n=1 Tax=Alnus glutinosa TaxID=3517 RepID=UPI002D7980C4|nr:uncharacterized protein LOC133862961 isoform X2 [Alnus glutinosa]